MAVAEKEDYEDDADEGHGQTDDDADDYDAADDYGGEMMLSPDININVIFQTRMLYN